MSRAEVPDPYVRHGSLRMGDRTKGIVEVIWRNLTLRNLTGLKDNGTRRNLGKPNLALRKNCSIEFAAGIQDFQRLPVSFQLGEPASSFSHQAEKDAKEFRTWGFITSCQQLACVGEPGPRFEHQTWMGALYPLGEALFRRGPCPPEGRGERDGW